MAGPELRFCDAGSRVGSDPDILTAWRFFASLLRGSDTLRDLDPWFPQCRNHADSYAYSVSREIGFTHHAEYILMRKSFCLIWGRSNATCV